MAFAAKAPPKKYDRSQSQFMMRGSSFQRLSRAYNTTVRMYRAHSSGNRPCLVAFTLMKSGENSLTAFPFSTTLPPLSTGLQGVWVSCANQFRSGGEKHENL